jgi:short-subunit dehydrogenase
VPLRGMYSASKHAVKGFTDALRVEACEIDDAPVSITLIQPTAVDTPFPSHARNYLPNEPQLPTPRIAPEDVARAILRAATRPTRDKKVGVMAKVATALSKVAPRLGDKMSAKQEERRLTEWPARHPEGTLYHSSEESGLAGRTRGSEN